MIQQLKSDPAKTEHAKTSSLSDCPSRDFSARFIDSVDELDRLVPQWNRLMQLAIHQNLMFDPDFLIPAFKHLAGKNVRILAIEAPPKNNSNGPPVLCGLLPLQNKKIYGMPLSGLEIWLHDHAVDGTPLLRRDCAKEALHFLFDFLARSEKTNLLSMDSVANFGEFAEVLTDVLFERKLRPFHRDSFSRACFRPESDAKVYFQKHVSNSVQRTQRRLLRRLDEQGDVTVVCCRDGLSSESMIEHFLRLEASGWKSNAGTAMQCSPQHECFFREMVSRSMNHNKLSFLTVKLNGQPIAMLCDLYTGQIGYSFKTAFDHTLAAYSPGMMAEMRNIEYLHDVDIDYMDSCTVPENETMNRIWGGRLRFQSLVIPLRGKWSRAAVATMPLIQMLKHG